MRSAAAAGLYGRANGAIAVRPTGTVEVLAAGAAQPLTTCRDGRSQRSALHVAKPMRMALQAAGRTVMGRAFEPAGPGCFAWDVLSAARPYGAAGNAF